MQKAVALESPTAPFFAFPPPAAPGEDLGRLSAIDFVLSRTFNSTNDSSRMASLETATSSDVILIAAKKINPKMYQEKVREAWKIAFPNVTCPESHPNTPQPAGGRD